MPDVDINALGDQIANLTLKQAKELSDYIKEKYGIEPVGFWTTVVGDSNQKLTYILRWADMAERERKWAAFSADPDWNAAKAASEADKIIVERIENSFLAPTAFSPMR